MKYLILFLIAPLLSFVAYGAVPDTLYIKVLKAISTQNSHLLTDDQYDEISENIQRGDRHWVALYPKLSVEPFLGVTSFQEGLDTDLALALPINTDEVLKQVTPVNIGQVCSMPFIEPTRDSIYRYYDLTRAALVKVGLPSQKCLSILDASMQSIKAHDSQGKIKWGEGEY